MLVVSESYKHYQNGAVSNQLTFCGRGVRVVGDSEFVHMLQGVQYRDTVDSGHTISLAVSLHKPTTS
jgi:hypothetical protein